MEHEWKGSVSLPQPYMFPSNLICRLSQELREDQKYVMEETLSLYDHIERHLIGTHAWDCDNMSEMETFCYVVINIARYLCYSN